MGVREERDRRGREGRREGKGREGGREGMEDEGGRMEGERKKKEKTPSCVPSGRSQYVLICCVIFNSAMEF